MVTKVDEHDPGLPYLVRFPKNCEWMGDNELEPADPETAPSRGTYVTKDSGDRQDFESGARRDLSEGKPRPDLISSRATLRAAELMARGADKYGARNWEQGMPTSRFLESAERHLLLYKLGERDEDHLAAVRFNIDGVMHFEGTQWDDINKETK